jgi:hypothetical protein
MPKVANYLEAVLEGGAGSLDAPDTQLGPHGLRDRAGRYPLLADEDLIHRAFTAGGHDGGVRRRRERGG